MLKVSPVKASFAFAIHADSNYFDVFHGLLDSQ